MRGHIRSEAPCQGPIHGYGHHVLDPNLCLGLIPKQTDLNPKQRHRLLGPNLLPSAPKPEPESPRSEAPCPTEGLVGDVEHDSWA